MLHCRTGSIYNLPLSLTQSFLAVAQGQLLELRAQSASGLRSCPTVSSFLMRDPQEFLQQCSQAPLTEVLVLKYILHQPNHFLWLEIRFPPIGSKWGL